MIIRFWGTRGSIPTPGPRTIKYGGNTPCVEVRIGENIFIFDAGTGIRELGNALLEEFKSKPLTIFMFITHTHWDHIQGFPFFLPAYQSQNSIHIYGPPGRDKSLMKVLQDQMDWEYFPVAMGDLTPNLEIDEFRQELAIGATKVTAFYVNHPAMTLAFRLEHNGKSLVYLTDNEPYKYTLSTNPGGTPREEEFSEQQDQRLVNFISNADLLIVEAQYTLEEYLNGKIGWGHSPIESVVEFAARGNVRQVALFHHDPVHDDAMVDSMVLRAQQFLKQQKKEIVCFGAQEGMTVSLE
ncbi:MAG: MBL fold metallo-hydrolase [Ignavibacteria bacterium]|nr:MBL fold metallo-hydrolase [Ignavibacteria bacterium]